jgi:hypothetical protein
MLRDKKGDHGTVCYDNNIARGRVAENLVDGRMESRMRLVGCLLSEAQLVRTGEEGGNRLVKMFSGEIANMGSIVLVQAIAKPP